MINQTNKKTVSSICRSSPMASSSSSRTWRYDVFVSFRGEDVRKNFLSHLRKEFEREGFDTFDDEEMERGQSISPELINAIRDSRIALVLLSKNYASSSWCLNELMEIMKCKETEGQTVMTVFYNVDPSDVRKQTGQFGKAFDETCVGKGKEIKSKWSKALTDVANIAGEDSQKWRNEADMIEKIATDVSKVLYSTASKDFDDLVGMEAHVTKMYSLLRLESNDVRMVGICGPLGIGKTTIARALYNRHSSAFQNHCFMEDVKGHKRRAGDLDDYGLKLHLQQRFLSQIFGLKDLKLRHLGELQERLKYRKVLVVLDDTDELEQLKTLADQPHWFGLGSRIIVTTENKDILSGHGVNQVYEVRLPSRDEALQIFSQYAFGKNTPPSSYRRIILEFVDVVERLPLGLSILGSSLLRKGKDEWLDRLSKYRTSVHWKIEEVLRTGYDSLDESEKAIFLHIACLFHGKKFSRVTQLLADSDLSVIHGLKSLEKSSLIQIIRGKIYMHRLLQQVGWEIVRRQSNEPGKRQFLRDAKEIYDVLKDKTGTGAVLGVSLSTSEIEELSITDRAFKRMHNLLFLRFHNNFSNGRLKVHFPNGLDLPRKLRLLHWDAYALKSMPGFSPEYLIELTLRDCKLDKLWKEPLLLRSLKKLDLSRSRSLKKIPNLSKATNLEKLNLSFCEAIVELPSFIRELNKLKKLNMSGCTKLKVLPTNINLESLSYLNLNGCSELKSFPEISENIETLYLQDTAIKAVPFSVRHWSRLTCLSMFDCKYLTTFPVVPDHLIILGLDGTGMEEVPSWIERLIQLRFLFMADCKSLRSIPPSICKLENLAVLNFRGNNFESIPDCLKFLSQLRELHVSYCTKLISLPVLPNSLFVLSANGCESLVRISQSFDNRWLRLKFGNCSKLDQEAQELIQQSVCLYTYLPGGEVPAYFTHGALGNSLTIHLRRRPLSSFLGFKACVMLATGHKYNGANDVKIVCNFSRRLGDSLIPYDSPSISIPLFQTHHLFIFSSDFLQVEDNDTVADEANIEIMFEFNCTSSSGFVDLEVIGCGLRFMEAYTSQDNRLDQLRIPTYVHEEDESRGLIESHGLVENGEEHGHPEMIKAQISMAYREEYYGSHEIVEYHDKVENDIFMFFLVSVVIVAVLLKFMRVSLEFLLFCGLVVVSCFVLCNRY